LSRSEGNAKKMSPTDIPKEGKERALRPQHAATAEDRCPEKFVSFHRAPIMDAIRAGGRKGDVKYPLPSHKFPLTIHANSTR
jgi:hypothetical protein